MKLETAGSLPVENATEKELREAFGDDAKRGEFIILSQTAQIYMQASGQGDGPYCLEYREGNEARHYCAGEEFRKEDVQRAFLSYLAGDNHWRSEFAWKKLKPKAWWNLW